MEYVATQCPYIASGTVDDYSLIFTTTVDFSNLGIIYSITNSNVNIPPDMKFIPTYPNLNTIVLTPTINGKLSSLIIPTILFGAFGLLN